MPTMTIVTTEPKGATQLAILGVVCRAPALGAEIVSLVKHIVGRSWQPTSDVIGTSIEELCARSLLTREDSGRNVETTHYAITAAGRSVLNGLLRDPLRPTPQGLDAGAIALKVCFLDLLEPGAQAEQLRAIIDLYDTEIGHLRHALDRCACDWAYVPGWMALEVDRLECERQWFRNQVLALPLATAAAR